MLPPPENIGLLFQHCLSSGYNPRNISGARKHETLEVYRGTA